MNWLCNLLKCKSTNNKPLELVREVRTVLRDAKNVTSKSKSELGKTTTNKLADLDKKLISYLDSANE